MSSLNHGHYVILFGNQVTIRLFDSYYLSKLFFVTDLSQSLLFFLLVLENKYSMFYISLFNFICKIWLILLDCWRMHSLIFHLLASLTSFAQMPSYQLDYSLVTFGYTAKITCLTKKITPISPILQPIHKDIIISDIFKNAFLKSLYIISGCISLICCCFCCFYSQK